MTLRSFNQARIIVTGAASGIGLVLAKRMIADGAKLAFCDLDAQRLERAEDQLPGAKGFLCDVSDREALEEFMANAIEFLGGLDVGWNNAGTMQQPSPVQDLELSEIERVMAINFHAVIHGSQLMARHMIKQGMPALIINTGSENSLFHAVPGGAAYVASKMAVRAMTQSLLDDTPDFIDVKLLCPGFVNTGLGDPDIFKHGMDLERFAEIAYPLLLSDQFYLVTHGYNAVRVRQGCERLLTEIEVGSASEEETRMFDTYNLLGLSR